MRAGLGGCESDGGCIPRGLPRGIFKLPDRNPRSGLGLAAVDGI
jgi:hypothetical protein